MVPALAAAAAAAAMTDLTDSDRLQSAGKSTIS